METAVNGPRTTGGHNAVGTDNVRPSVALACQEQGAGREAREHFDQVREEADLFVPELASTFPVRKAQAL